MIFTENDLDNLARLARVSIKSEEKTKMLHDMQAILEHVSEVNSLDIPEDVTAPTVFNVVREDEVLRVTGALTETILANAPEREGDCVKVSQVFK